MMPTMPGLPQLLNWPAAAIAAAVAVPLLLLLYFLKLRRAPRPISSTLLWKRSVQDLQVNAPFQRIRRNLLLFLQLLVLAALLFALARPVGEGTTIAGARSILLIDRSASMSTDDGEGTRLAEAKERAKAVVDTMTRGDQAMVIEFSDAGGSGIRQAFTGDTGALKNAIDAITPSDRPTQPGVAYEQANASSSFMDERLREDPLTAASVFLFSDGRVNAGAASDLSLRGSLTYERVGTAAAENLAVVAFGVKRNYERPDQAQAFVRVGNYGPDVAEAAVRISVARVDAADPGATLEFRPVAAGPAAINLPPARWSDEAWQEAMRQNDPAALEAARDALANTPRREGVDVALELPGAAVVKAELMRADDPTSPVNDALTADDVAYVVVPPPEPVRVVLVTRGNYFLRLLLENQPLDDPQVVTPTDYEAMLGDGTASEFDVTIFDNYQPPTVPEAGTFVYSGVLPPATTTQIEAVTNDVGVATFYEAGEVLDWQRDHPMLRGLSLNRLWVNDGRLVTLPLGSELLIEGIGGPLLALERLGRRTNLVFTFDLMRSTWPRQETFPYFGYLMFQYLAASGDVRAQESIRPGGVVEVPPVAIERAGLAAGDEVRVESIEGDGEVSSGIVGDDGRLVLGPFERVGVYATDPPLAGYERVAVSLLDTVESNVLPSATDPGNFARVEADVVLEGEESEQTTNVEWWWWLVAAGTGLLMVEWLAYTRRVVG
jgi:hypothetical protein